MSRWYLSRWLIVSLFLSAEPQFHYFLILKCQEGVGWVNAWVENSFQTVFKLDKKLIGDGLDVQNSVVNNCSGLCFFLGSLHRPNVQTPTHRASCAQWIPVGRVIAQLLIFSPADIRRADWGTTITAGTREEGQKNLGATTHKERCHGGVTVEYLPANQDVAESQANPGTVHLVRTNSLWKLVKLI
jgi:hypothetical protein